MSIYGKKGNVPSKFQVEILMTKIKEYFNLQKDRKSNEAVKEEKALVKLLNTNSRSKLEEQLLMEKIVNILRYINALRLLLSYAEAIKTNSVTVSEPLKYQDRLHELMPYTVGIIYAAQPTGLACIEEFKVMMEQIFGRQNLELSYTKGQMIPIELRKCFEPSQPTFKHINQYAIEMCQRNEITLETLNGAGHNFTVSWNNAATYVNGVPPEFKGGYPGGNQGNNGNTGNTGNNGNYGNSGNNGYNGGNRGNNHQPYDYGYGSSYNPTQNQNNISNSFQQVQQSSTFYTSQRQSSQQPEFRYPVTTSTYIGPPNSSVFH